MKRPPAGITLDIDGDRIEIRRRWFDGVWPNLPLIGITTALLGAAYSYYGEGHSWGALLWLIAALYFIYDIVANFINSTTITLANELISIRHGPLPWLGSLEIDARTLADVVVETNILSEGPNLYRVIAVLLTGHRVRLVDKMDCREQALFIERKIEKFLGIEDAQVKGEVQ